MNVQKTSFNIETALDSRPCESLVEGRLSPPAEKADIGRILLVGGKVNVNTEPGDGKVFMEGSVKFFVVYFDTEGNLDSFESMSHLRHTENVENAGAGMNVYVKGAIKEIEYIIEDGRTIYVKGIVSMNINGSITISNETAAAEESPDMQVRMLQARIACTKDYKKDTALIREDIRIPQSMPRAEKILYADAYAAVKSVKMEDAKIIIEGDIKMMILYLSEDKNAPLQYFYESLPFADMLATDNAAADDTVMADADLFDLSIEIAEDERDILRMSANVMIVFTINSHNDIEYMEDAYSLKNKLNLKYKDVSFKSAAQSGNIKAFARCAITIPASQPSISRTVCIKASPVIASAVPGVDRVYLEGLMMFTICYASPEGIQSFSGETPFESEVQIEGITSSHEIEAAAEVEYCSFEGAGKDISVKFMMDVMIKAFSKNALRLVSEIEETDEPVSRKKGITIYFADGGESLWDIARRYSTTLDNVSRFNPDMGDNAVQGQKILIMG